MLLIASVSSAELALSMQLVSIQIQSSPSSRATAHAPRILRRPDFSPTRGTKGDLLLLPLLMWFRSAKSAKLASSPSTHVWLRMAYGGTAAPGNSRSARVVVCSSRMAVASQSYFLPPKFFWVPFPEL
ncbi:hypothetical protein GGS26DRAFT_555126 [Hypomontagnella submonticulosa]|nr:hypothetical protein GGS26DRAFT_555126 [Hypomontagnella submonticulosa]